MLGAYDKALADLTEAVNGNPGDTSNLDWIPREFVAQCPDDGFRKGLLKLADRTIELTDGIPGAYFTRAQLHVTFGQADKARADFEKVVSSDEASYYAHYQYALICLMMDDEEAAYRKACGVMLEKFAATEESNEARFTAWTCALSPNALEDYAPAVQLAERAVKAEPKLASHQQSLGAILYRAGSFQEAREHLNIAAESAQTERTSAAYGWYFLAMTHHRLGHADEAREWLAKANEQADRELNDAGSPAPWTRKLTLELLRKEAEELLRTDAERLLELPVEAPRPSATEQQTTDN